MILILHHILECNTKKYTNNNYYFYVGDFATIVQIPNKEELNDATMKALKVQKEFQISNNNKFCGYVRKTFIFL